jgi:hypothetical protein
MGVKTDKKKGLAMSPNSKCNPSIPREMLILIARHNESLVILSEWEAQDKSHFHSELSDTHREICG